jgi:hypothetical protein
MIILSLFIRTKIPQLFHNYKPQILKSKLFVFETNLKSSDTVDVGAIDTDGKRALALFV